MKLSLIATQGPIVQMAAEGKMVSEDLRGDASQIMSEVAGAQWASHKILLDLGKASYIDSSAIGWLLSCSKLCKQEGGQLVLHSVPPNIHHIFSLLKIGAAIPIAPSESDAMALVNGAPQ